MALLVWTEVLLRGGMTLGQELVASACTGHGDHSRSTRSVEIEPSDRRSDAEPACVGGTTFALGLFFLVAQ